MPERDLLRFCMPPNSNRHHLSAGLAVFRLARVRRPPSRYNFDDRTPQPNLRSIIMKSVILSIVVLSLCCPISVAQEQSDSRALEVALAQIGKVDVHGAGHAEATDAMKVLNSVSAEQLPLLFEAFDESNPISANWIRAAIQKVVRGDKSLPVETIKAYFDDPSNNPKGRWLAWQMICDRDPEFRSATIDALALDASMPLREIGIAKIISDAEALGSDVDQLDQNAKNKKIDKLKSALENARDVDQIKTIAKLLKPLGENINLREQLGFLATWNLVSGFDNKDEKGFDVVYDPEVEPKQVVWKTTTTTHETGVVDLNEIVGKEKGSITYAWGIIGSSVDREAEVRIGTPNAHKIWVNGELVMSNEIYHNSNSIDKFSAPVKLREGMNQVLVKVCQNEQTQPWAQDWSFQVRFCDSTGKPIR